MNNSYSKHVYGIFSECFPPIMDGVSLTVQNYADWLHKKNENVCVVTPYIPRCHKETEYPILNYFSLPIPMRKPYRYGLPGIDCAFRSEINRQNFQLVHAHCPFSSGQIALRVAKSQKIPIVATFHSKYRSDFDRIIPSKALINKLVRDIVNFYEQVDEVWIPQASVEETLREYGYKGAVQVVENGNDFASNNFDPAFRKDSRDRLNISDNELMFLFVGQHVWEKNNHFLITALSMLKTLPYRMFFIGTGYAAVEMKQLVKRLGIADKVTFTGTVKDRDVLKRYYASADLFLFPSFYDNAPLVVREAAALHTPSLMLKGSTASSVIQNGINGFLAENTHEAFAGKIEELVSNRGHLAEVGKQASQTIARSWENVVEEVIDRYSNLIKRYNN